MEAGMGHRDAALADRQDADRRAPDQVAIQPGSVVSKVIHRDPSAVFAATAEGREPAKWRSQAQ